MADGIVVDDGGTIAATAAALTAGGVMAGARAMNLVRHWGVELHRQAQANASGRPGPRVITGNLRRSITLRTGVSGGTAWALVGTNAPQARRLELGFHGTDSRGRTYSQPPYPFLRPALDAIKPRFEAAARLLGATVLGPGSGT